jgi:hypothetical protein
MTGKAGFQFGACFFLSLAYNDQPKKTVLNLLESFRLSLIDGLIKPML